MKFLLSFLLMVASIASLNAAADTPVYEFRIYYTHPGKMPDLLKRFREHTCALFEKHGMVNVGYWLPVEEKDQDKLYYVLKHPSRDAAKAAWKAFGDDPEWKQVRDASEAAGKIVQKVDSTFLAAADYTPAQIPALTGQHIYELRIYTTNEGKLDALDTRFRDHTTKLFEKHGMTNVLYTHPTDADKGAGHILIYWLAHNSVDAAKKSFTDFRADPEWIKVKDASEAAGPILKISPPVSIYLTPTDFSALK
jgi:hypothetical protein